MRQGKGNQLELGTLFVCRQLASALFLQKVSAMGRKCYMQSWEESLTVPGTPGRGCEGELLLMAQPCFSCDVDEIGEYIIPEVEA